MQLDEKNEEVDFIGQCWKWNHNYILGKLVIGLGYAFSFDCKLGSLEKLVLSLFWTRER